MSSRKLQQEFDKLQKKVAEGLQQFEEIYEKIGVTENPSLKDKLEGDLRKEIKKLQRSRDQVKQWSSDSSNKLDKEILLETRSRIENAMERFKEVEKVSKMKQFSNEGLELQTKLGARGLDEAKKNEASKYIIDVLDELNRQNELLSGEMAQFSHKKKGAAQAAVAELAAKVDRNNVHISRLELVLRNLENYQLEPEKIDDIRDDLDYYVENNQSSDFVEYDDFYDLLELDESLEVLPAGAQVPEVASMSPKKEKADTKETKELKEPKPEPSSDRHEKADAKPEYKHEKADKADKRGDKSRVTITIGNSIQNSGSQTTATSAPSTAPSSSAANVAPTSAPAGRAPPPGLNPQSKSGTPVKMTVAEELKKKAMTQAAAASAAKGGSQKGAPPASEPASVASNMGHSLASIASNAASMAQNVASSATSMAQNVAHSIASTSASPSPVLSRPKKEFTAPFWDNSADIAALAHARLSNPPPFHAISQQLEASLLNCPDSFDSEKPRQYNPTNVHPSSVDYPQEPMFELNSAAIMRKFDTDTLFFCFYYNEPQDALAKWNAARELSRRGWVFNSATKQWFSKEERPKSRSILALSGQESASFKYFDYESSWLVRRKDNFEFERELQRTF